MDFYGPTLTVIVALVKMQYARLNPWGLGECDLDLGDWFAEEV